MLEGAAMEPLVKAFVALTLAAPVIPSRRDISSLSLAPKFALSLYKPKVPAIVFPYGELQAAEYRVAARKAAAHPFGYSASWNGNPRSGDIAK
jgi:hypothetical protein